MDKKSIFVNEEYINLFKGALMDITDLSIKDNADDDMTAAYAFGAIKKQAEMLLNILDILGKD